MAGIHHLLKIKAPLHDVFLAVSTPQGLNVWWTADCKGFPEKGNDYDLIFTGGYHWKARVKEISNDLLFTLEITSADDDWKDTRISFQVTQTNKHVSLSFTHDGWKEVNDHFRQSSFCWAMYLRVLKRHLELGEYIPYDERDLA